MNAKPLPASTAAVIQNLDTAPACQQINAPGLQTWLGISRTTLNRRIEAGALPRPHKLGSSRNYWTVGEIRQALGMGKAAA